MKDVGIQGGKGDIGRRDETDIRYLEDIVSDDYGKLGPGPCPSGLPGDLGEPGFNYDEDLTLRMNDNSESICLSDDEMSKIECSSQWRNNLLSK